MLQKGTLKRSKSSIYFCFYINECLLSGSSNTLFLKSSFSEVVFLQTPQMCNFVIDDVSQQKTTLGWTNTMKQQLEIQLKVRQIRNDFFKPTFLPKNERTNLTLLLADLFSFFFWKRVKTPKPHLEINWYLSNVQKSWRFFQILWLSLNRCTYFNGLIFRTAFLFSWTYVFTRILVWNPKYLDY